MRFNLTSRRRFIRLMGISSVLVALGDLGRKSLAQTLPVAVAQAQTWAARHAMTSTEYQSQKPGFEGDLDNLMWEVKSKVNSWPSFDLF